MAASSYFRLPTTMMRDFLLVSALGLAIYAAIAATINNPTYYSQQFNVSLSSRIPANNGTTLELYQEIPLYSTVAQPPGFAPVEYVLANYEIIGFTDETDPSQPRYPVMSLVGSVVYTTGDSLQIQGTVIRDITISEDGTITRNRLISVNIAVIGGSGKYVGAWGNWQSFQSLAFETRIVTEFQVPRW